jgi:hypothetical protein
MNVIFAAVVAGLVAHHGAFIHGEWHLRIRNVVSGHIALAFLILCILNPFFDTLKDAVQSLFIFSGSYLVSLFTSISIYRLFFHPLRKFPGPRLAALTKFWHVYQARNSTNYLVMQDMHSKYGTFVRTGKHDVLHQRLRY